MIVRAAVDLSWLEQRAGCCFNRQARAIEAVDNKGAIAGMVALDWCTPASAQMTVAIDRPIAVRSLLKAAFDWVFNQAGKEIARGIVRASNTRAIVFDEGLGFKEVGRLRDGWAIGEDLVVLEMRRADCRWLGRGPRLRRWS